MALVVNLVATILCTLGAVLNLVGDKPIWAAVLAAFAGGNAVLVAVWIAVHE